MHYIPPQHEEQEAPMAAEGRESICRQPRCTTERTGAFGCCRDCGDGDDLWWNAGEVEGAPVLSFWVRQAGGGGRESDRSLHNKVDGGRRGS